MLVAVTRNRVYSGQAVRTLLGLRTIDRVSEDVMVSCLQSYACDLSVLKTFEDLWGTLAFSEKELASLCSSNTNINKVKFVIDRCEHFSLTESVFRAALAGVHKHLKIDLLLEYDPDFKVQDHLIAETVASDFGNQVLEVYARHGKPLVLTEEAMRAAASIYHGVDALDIILRHDSDAKISDAMILEALRSRYGSRLITCMLESDTCIQMQEDFLIEAASNQWDGALIFEALHQKGRISVSGLLIEASHSPPAKRQRVSFSPLPPLREVETISTPITTRVIEAAAANKDTEQRQRLLSLFQKWDVLTDKDAELFHFSDDDAAGLSDDDASTQYDYQTDPQSDYSMDDPDDDESEI